MADRHVKVRANFAFLASQIIQQLFNFEFLARDKGHGCFRCEQLVHVPAHLPPPMGVTH